MGRLGRVFVLRSCSIERGNEQVDILLRIHQLEMEILLMFLFPLKYVDIVKFHSRFTFE